MIRHSGNYRKRLRKETHIPSLMELKARQSLKIREIGQALIAAGFVTLDKQATALELPRSTAWTILSAEHKGTGISARIICRMLSSKLLPLPVRAKIIQYAEERAVGIYGGTKTQNRRFASKLKLNSPDEGTSVFQRAAGSHADQQRASSGRF